MWQLKVQLCRRIWEATNDANNETITMLESICIRISNFSAVLHDCPNSLRYISQPCARSHWHPQTLRRHRCRALHWLPSIWTMSPGFGLVLKLVIVWIWVSESRCKDVSLCKNYCAFFLHDENETVVPQSRLDLFIWLIRIAALLQQRALAVIA